MDALAIGRATLMGYDWGGRAACVVSALWPERVRGLVSCTGYNIQDISRSAKPAVGRRRSIASGTSIISTRARGVAGLTAEPPRRLPAAVEAVVAELAVRRRDLRGERQVVRQSRFRRRRDPVLSPPLRLCAGRSGAGRASRRSCRRSPPSPCRPSTCMAMPTASARPRIATAMRGKFTGGYERRMIARVGHNVPQEAPDGNSRGDPRPHERNQAHEHRPDRRHRRDRQPHPRRGAAPRPHGLGRHARSAQARARARA